jgi:spore cortex protein
MKKATFTSLSAALILGGLVGCTNEQAVEDRYENTTRPIGYYTNDDRDADFDYNNGRGMDQGPLTDMFDLGENNNRNDRFINTRRSHVDNVKDRNGIRDNYDRGYDREEDGEVYNYDRNYERDGSLADRINDRIENMANIEDVNTVVYRDTVIVGIDTNDRNDKEVEQKVRKAIKGLAAGKEVRVVTDENMFRRLGTINDGLRNGNALDEFKSDLREMMDNMGDAINNDRR